MKQRFAAHYYVVWIATDKNIMVLCDEQVEESLKICIYDSESFSFDDMEYKEEII